MTGDDFEVVGSDERKRYTENELALAHAKELLKAAMCPNGECVDGLLDGKPGDAMKLQCLWCRDRELLTRG